MVAKIQGGAHNNSVTVLLKPIVLLNVGKKALKLKETTMEARMSASHQTFQSVRAITKPWACPAFSVSSLSPTPTSSSSLFSARRRSKGDSHVEVAGKSGSMNMATNAKNTVKEPSM